MKKLHGYTCTLMKKKITYVFMIWTRMTVPVKGKKKLDMETLEDFARFGVH